MVIKVKKIKKKTLKKEYNLGRKYLENVEKHIKPSNSEK